MIKGQIKKIHDSFSRRDAKRGKGYKPDAISETLRNKIMLLFREVLSGNWTDGSLVSPGDHTDEFWREMHFSFQHLYGRFRFTTAAVTEPMDAIGFVMACQPAEFFDFLELSFKTEAIAQILYNENALVDAINEIFKIESAPYQLTQMVKREEPSGRGQGRVIRTVAA
jgi:AbiJ-like protein